MNKSVKYVNGGIAVEDEKGRAWVWDNRAVRQALDDAKACRCGECVCCTIAKLKRGTQSK